MKKLVLLCSAASVVLPAAAMAQSTGSIDFEKETIVVTGTRANNGVGGIVAPDSTKAKGVITQELIGRQSPGQTVLNTINLIPSVNFTNSDPFGSAGGNLRIRGFDGNRISLTFDGIPLNDSGNYAIFANQQIDPELIEQVNVNLGVTDVDSPTASAAGGTVNYRTLTPRDKAGVRFSMSLGDFDYHRGFAMVETGKFTSFGTKAWLSGSFADIIGTVSHGRLMSAIGAVADRPLAASALAAPDGEKWVESGLPAWRGRLPVQDDKLSVARTDAPR